MLSRRRLLILAAAAAALIVGGNLPVQAKRTPPPTVAPVTVEGVEYRVAYERFSEGERPAGLRAYLLATKPGTYTELWKTRLYEVRYQGNLETDVQDDYVKSLSRELPGLLALTEEKQAYVVNLASRAVKPLPPGNGLFNLLEEGRDPGPGKRFTDARGVQRDCRLHQIALKEDAVGIVFGLVSFPPDVFRAMVEKFPNAATVNYGGCIPGPSPWAVVRYCPRCREAQEAWLKERNGARP